jgi:hypothetical protein
MGRIRDAWQVLRGYGATGAIKPVMPSVLGWTINFV